MWSRRARIPAAVIAVAVSLLAAGCGSSSPGTTSASASANQSPQAHSIQPAINFSDCMRSHGVPSFPDPTSDPHGFKESLDPSVPHSPAFLSGFRACHHLLPNPGGQSQSDARSRAEVAAALAFARCLRRHGFPNFPDPTPNGDLSHQMLAAAGIDIHQPAAKQAADACVTVTHGYITKAAVARFIAGQ